MASPPPLETFTNLPILPLSAALSPDTKPQFLADLRSALLHVGFLYLTDTGLPDDVVHGVVRECVAFFDTLPLHQKERIEMKNEKSFLGWSRVSDFSTLLLLFFFLFLLFFLAMPLSPSTRSLLRLSLSHARAMQHHHQFSLMFYPYQMQKPP